MSRRKPKTTYKSPTAEDNLFITIPSPRPARKPPSDTGSSTPSSSRTIHSPGLHDTHIHRRRYTSSPSLPLFHPLGHLAMSLPPLDPMEYGLPVPSVPDDHRRNQMVKSKRPAPKTREAEEDITAAFTTVSTIAAVAARETKERASPRKRRPGGKRKRKDADDGDATYPAKRTRAPRGGVVGQNAEDDSPADSMQSNDIGTIPEALSDAADAIKRRSTRAKGTSKRRDSSASESTSAISANAINAEMVTNPDAPTPANTEKATKSVDLEPLIESQDKEEGELSEGPNS